MGDLPGMLRRFLVHLRPYRGTGALIFLGLLLEMAFNSAVPFSFKFIVDKALLGGERGLLPAILGGLGAGAVVVAFAGLGRDYLYARLVADAMADLRARMYERLQRLSMDYFARTQAGDILARFSGDLAVVEDATASAVPWAILPGLDVLSSTTLLFVLDWRLASVAMLAWPLTIAGPRLFAPRAAEASYQRKEEEAAALSAVQENLLAQPVIKAFGLAEHAMRRFQERSERVKDRMVRVGFYGALVERSAGIGIMFLQVLVMGAGAWLVSRGTLSVGSLASFVTLFLSLCYSLSYVTQYVPTLVEAAGGLRRIEELLAEEPSVPDAGRGRLAPLSRAIEFRGVSFGYAPDRLNLRDASFTIPRGTYAAFVGASGSGKSTVLNLVMRFYDPRAGSVAVDGVDLREAPQDSLRAQLGVVFQESFLFDLTVRENIRLGRPGAADAEVEEAAKAAEIHEVILGMPLGYDTPVGERGGRLSGGQRQRVAIARALLRDPRILLLDEATSALDPGTEAAVNATLERAGRGRTTLSVTHRLASVVRCDAIFVLDGGRVVEQGRHEELLARGGAYKRLWDKQSGFSVSAQGDHATVTAQRLRALPLFASLDDALLERSARLFGTEHYPAGRVVTEEGDIDGRFFLIARGTVEILRRAAGGENRRVRVQQDGDHFGEIALLKAVPRTATVRTLTPCTLLALQRAEFHELLAQAPRLRETLERALEERLRRDAEAATPEARP